MYKHSDYCTHFNNVEDRDILTRKSFDVNMRLLQTSPRYFDIIRHICSYIKWSALTEKEGYSKPKGWSGPNSGIPFRIIYVPPYGIMLNPIWVSNNNNAISEDVISNCGSLTLPKPKTVSRVKSINIEYWDIWGHHYKVNDVTKDLGGYTFQHEFLHCEGELI